MKTLCITLAIICLTSASINLKYEDLFVTWKMRHNKEYGTHLEEAVKYENFFSNYDFIQAFNKENNGAQLALNQFADMTSEEFGAMFLGLDSDEVKKQAAIYNGDTYDENGAKITVTANVNVDVKVGTNNLQAEPEPMLGATNLGIATSINWVTKGAVTTVKNQPCGNCWSYSGAAAMEGYYFLKKGAKINLSSQQLSDCTTSCSGCGGCGGLTQALQYTASKGIESLTNYPFTSSGSGSCKYSSTKVAIKNTGVKSVASRSVSALKTALNVQPVSIAVQADQRAFQFYSSGVIQSGCGSSVNHAILAVGYTSVNGVDAFYVKNSWGTSWGINGYAYIGTSGTANSGYGVCGILTMAAYPV